jgi:arsenate reductase|tara:strand:- start:769 stop:1125 length:357 start_codon:yes stop_codon:yes gene_type:complete
MNKIYYLSTCYTCKKIINSWKLNKSIKLIDVKKNPINSKGLEEVYLISKNYEDIFNKRALLFREVKKETKNITENTYKELILNHYSFLKRPILIIGNKLFIGNSKETVLKAKIELEKL